MSETYEYIGIIVPGNIYSVDRVASQWALEDWRVTNFVQAPGHRYELLLERPPRNAEEDNG